MKHEVTIGGQTVTVQETGLDRMIRYVAPIYGAKRFRARLFQAAAGAYIGASRSRRSLSHWNPLGGDADSDTIYDLPALRERSSDLIRNAPLACGAINTGVTNIVGSGLKLQAAVDYEALGWTEEQADAWERETEREFHLLADSPEIDVCRTSNFPALQELSLRSAFEKGDVFALLASIARPGIPYRTKIQLIEADRVSNPDSRADTERLVAGVEKDENGAPIRYYIATVHPGSTLALQRREWTSIPAYGDKTGRRNILHLFKPIRVGQTRGIPYLAPVIEPFKQLDRYSKAEADAAVVAAMLTVFIKTEMGDGTLAPMMPTSETGGSTTDEDYKLGNAAIIGLAPGEDISTVDPKRPNTAFDPFVLAIVRQIGVALEIPYEVLIKHFTASYSAARAALLEAWKFFSARRVWLATTFCQPIYETFLWEAVALGRINAPGFLSDPLLRKAYCGAEWIGPAKGMINEKDEVEAAQQRVNMTISTLEEETAQLTGGDWERKHKQRAKEKKMNQQAGLEEAQAPAVGRPPTLEQLNDRQ